MLALASLGEEVGGTATNDIDAMIDEVLDRLNQAHLFRLAVDDGQEDHAEALLHRCVFEELVEHNLGFCTTLEFDNDAHTVAVALVADVADVINDLVIDELGDALDEARLVHLVRNFGDDDRVALFVDVLDRSLGAHHEAATTSLVGVQDSAATVDECAGREVGALNDGQHLLERSA